MDKQSTKSGLMRQYETLYVLRPSLDEETSRGFMLKMKDWVEQQGGKNIQVLCWGRKKLAWLRHDLRKGLFIQHSYVGKPGITAPYERQLDVDERVLLRQTLMLKDQVNMQDIKELPDQLFPVKDPAGPSQQEGDKKNSKHSSSNTNGEK